MADDASQPLSDAKLVIEPVLETPPGDNPGESIAGLFDESSFSLASNKLGVVESILQLLTRDLKFTDFTRELLLSIMKAVKSEAGSLFEVDHQNQTLFFRATVGTASDTVSGFVIPMGQGIVGFVAESRQPLIVDDAAENRMHLKQIGASVGFETRNLIALPIIIRGKVYGVLELINRVGEEGFTPADQEFLSYCCQAAARAIEIRLMLAWSASQRKTEAA